MVATVKMPANAINSALYTIQIFSIPPYQSVSDVLHSIKGKTSRKLLQEFKLLSKQYWGQHLWARGYFADSSRNVTHENILEYTKNQDITEAIDSDFSISGET